MIGVISRQPLTAGIGVENRPQSGARQGGSPFVQKGSAEPKPRGRQGIIAVENFACEPPCRGLTGGAASVKNRGMSAQMFS